MRAAWTRSRRWRSASSRTGPEMPRASKPDSAAPPAPPATPTGRPADPCTIVICGAGGDLTKRKLLPALVNLAQAGLLAKQFAIVGFSRGARSDEEFRKSSPRRSRSSRPPRWSPRSGAGSCRASTTAAATSRTPAPTRSWPTSWRASRRSISTRGNYLFYLATAPGVLRRDRPRSCGAAGLTREEDGRWRRVIVEKPFGRDLDSARALNAGSSKCLARAADLPHRSLPRQGDGAEHPGLPLRQRHLRADLEPALHRPRADHRRPRRSASSSAAATTTRRARCATWCRTTSSSSSR